MLFSGGVRYYRCKECGAKFTDVTPTSILPIFGTVVLSSTLWNAFVYRYLPSKWASIPIALALALAFLYGTWLAIEYLTTGFMKRCLRCKGPLEVTGGGFYDGPLPNRWELVIYAICFLAPYCLLKIVGP